MQIVSVTQKPQGKEQDTIFSGHRFQRAVVWCKAAAMGKDHPLRAARVKERLVRDGISPLSESIFTVFQGYGRAAEFFGNKKWYRGVHSPSS